MAMLARRSRADDACSRIKDETRTNRMPPEYPASEPVFALSLRKVRTPAREAFIQLEVDGTVELIPRRSVRVLPFGAGVTRGTHEILASLSSGAASDVAARRARPEEITLFESGEPITAAALTVG